MERLTHVYDYEENLLFIHQNALDDKNDLVKISNEQYLNMVQAILSPAVIIILNNGRTRYYYHTISSNKTILVGAIYTNGLWEVQELRENPSRLFILTLAKKGLLEALHLENEIDDDDFWKSPGNISGALSSF